MKKKKVTKSNHKEKEKMKKKEKETKAPETQEALSVVVDDKGQLLINNSKRKIQPFAKFDSSKEVEVIHTDFDDVKKTKKQIALGDINVEESEKFQSRVDNGALEKLIPSINKKGVIESLKVTPHPEKEGEYLLVDGFTRIKAMKILSSKAECEKRNIVPERTFDNDTFVEVICLTTEDDQPLSDDVMWSVAGILNNIRKNWSLIDLGNNYKNLARQKINELLAETLKQKPQMKKHIDMIFRMNAPRQIFTTLAHLQFLTKEELGITRKYVLQELENSTALKSRQIEEYAQLSEVPVEYHATITGEPNQWGIRLDPANALKVFFKADGTRRSEKLVRSALEKVKQQVNPKGKGRQKVKGKDVDNALQESGAETETESPKRRSMSATEKEAFLMLLGFVDSKKKIPVTEFATVLDGFKNSPSLDDQIELFKNSTGIDLPEIKEYPRIKV